MAGFKDALLTTLNNPIQAWERLVARFKNAGETNFQLGCRQAEQGHVADAIVRFKLAVWFQPGHYRAWYNMACCLLAQGKQDKAITAFKRCLILKKNHEDALFMLASIDNRLLPPDLQPKSMPLALAVSHFDALAHNYNEVQIQYYHYQGHLALHHMIAAIMGAEGEYNILDLGCGTGLCAPLLRKLAKTMVGVDISSQMLIRAANVTDNDGKPLYDALKQADLRDFLMQYEGEGYDLIASANTMGYVGDLTAVFDGAWKTLAPGGYFAFSTDISRELDGYYLIPKIARFGHTPKYLREQAARVGFTEVHYAEIKAYPDYVMQQIMLRKP